MMTVAPIVKNFKFIPKCPHCGTTVTRWATGSTIIKSEYHYMIKKERNSGDADSEYITGEWDEDAPEVIDYDAEINTEGVNCDHCGEWWDDSEQFAEDIGKRILSGDYTLEAPDD